MLIVFGGLPGTGKTTIAQKLANKLAAIYIRIDSLEQAIVRAGISQTDMGPAGYFAGYAVAADNLRLGLTVIADSVNSLSLTRDAWNNVALEAGVRIVEVELICTNTAEHRQRIDSRTADIPGHALPNWKGVLERQYESWNRDHIVVDTAIVSASDAVNRIIENLPAMLPPLYDEIGSTYCTTRRADPAITAELARLINIQSDSRFLDVACGTGSYACALAALGGHWHGIDISEVMLKQAAEQNSNIEWKKAGVDALPFSAGFFDGAVCSLAIHHFPDLIRPFQEIWRVLSQGHFVIFTAFPEQMQNYWLCHYFPEMMRRSIEKMPSRESVIGALQCAGFEIESIQPFHITKQLQDLFLYSGKEHPLFYFDPTIRANISSFAALCTEEELQKGLSSLRSDLDSGQFLNVSQRYSSSHGDYAYVIANKRDRA